MKLRLVTVREDHGVVLEPDPHPSPEWMDDGVIRWLSVESAGRDELRRLFDRLGIDGELLAGHIKGEQWSHWMEREQFSVIAIPEPTAWTKYNAWFHLVALPETIVSVHGAEVPAIDTLIQRRWLDRPAPDPTMAAVLLHLLQCYAEEEYIEFDQIRLQVEQHAEGLRVGDTSFTVEHLEGLMTETHHMATVFFEYQRVCEGIDFARTRAISLATDNEPFRRGAQVLRRNREGVDQIQRRLEGLQRQHLMDRQAMTEGRLRILTVLSAVFLPLTLVAGIYGMNFANMPELDDAYAYFVVLVGMGVAALAMVSFFYWKGWFR